MDAATQQRFLDGLDDIGITLAHADDIDRLRGRPPGLADELTTAGRSSATA